MRVVALASGVNLGAALTSAKSGVQPLLIDSRPLTSKNQYYNTQGEHWQNKRAKTRRFTVRQFGRITMKRPEAPTVGSRRQAV